MPAAGRYGGVVTTSMWQGFLDFKIRGKLQLDTSIDGDPAWMACGNIIAKQKPLDDNGKAKSNN